jgi:hypothetical protein
MEGLLFAFLVPGAVFGYPILQVIVLRRWTGLWWYIGAVPLIAMAPALVFTAYALAAESNLWPIVLIFTSMAAIAYLLLLLGIRWVAQAVSD